MKPLNVTIAMVCTALLSLTVHAAPDALTPQKQRKEAPDFTLTDATGQPLTMDEKGMKIVKPFLAQKKIEYPVVIGNDGLAKQYNLTSMPMTLLIDRDGKIAVSHTGVVDKDNFESHVRTLLR